MLDRILALIFTWFQKRCQHPDYAVRADIHEGCQLPDQVQWCLRCGAYRHAHDGAVTSLWRVARADWAEDERRAP